MNNIEFDKIVTHLQTTTGFVFQGSQIYGGLSNSWDYGPLGSELKQNLKNLWRKKFVHESPTNVGIDAAILMNSKVWQATGHVSTFNDPLIDCKNCHNRYRADDLISEQYKDVDVNGMTIDDLNKFILEPVVRRNSSENFSGDLYLDYRVEIQLNSLKGEKFVRVEKKDLSSKQIN